MDNNILDNTSTATETQASSSTDSISATFDNLSKKIESVDCNLNYLIWCISIGRYQ